MKALVDAARVDPQQAQAALQLGWLVQALAAPGHAVVTEGDTEVPPAHNGCRYARGVPGALLTWIPGPVGHYVFLAEATAWFARHLSALEKL